MNEFVIAEKDSGQRLDRYIARLLPLAPKSFLYKALRNKDIRLNGKKAMGSETVQAGDRVLFRFPDLQFADLGGKTRQEAAGGPDGKTDPETESRRPDEERGLSPEFGSIIFEDEDILIADKQSGVLSQKAKPEDVSINEALLAYCGGKTDTFTPSVCNRLDRNTSGLLIFAKTYRGAREMAAALKERSAEKYYLAAVYGDVTEPGHRKARLVKDSRENRVEVLPEEGDRGDLIETAYRPLVRTRKNGDQITLLKIELITGKTHQIRAHMASAGFWILGDLKYGDPAASRKLHIDRLMLHSCELVLPGRGTFRAPVPDCFRELFGISGIL